MGVLIPGNDMTAVRRTATFFLNNFEVSSASRLERVCGLLLMRGRQQRWRRRMLQQWQQQVAPAAAMQPRVEDTEPSMSSAVPTDCYRLHRAAGLRTEPGHRAGVGRATNLH